MGAPGEAGQRREDGGADRAGGRPAEVGKCIESVGFLAALTSSGGRGSVVACRSAFAQGLPAPGPGGPPVPGEGGRDLVVPGIILGVALLGALILAVAIMDLRRKRRAQAIAIEGRSPTP